jgi:hypothetical protein
VLLRSGDDATVKAGAWIASELGWRARPVMEDLAILVSHPSKYVRFFVVDSILTAATAEHGEAIAGAIQTICDVEEAVRWKAMNFLVKATRDQLIGGLPHIDHSTVRLGTEWLIQADLATESKRIIAELESGEYLREIFAVTAAARIAMRDRSPLALAARSSNAEVSSFAKEQIESIGH